jgi:hypothetical protein
MPAHTHTGRPFNATTRLGKMMVKRGMRVKDVALGTGICERTISDYLRDWHRQPNATQQRKLVGYFKCQPWMIFDWLSRPERQSV